MIWNSSFLQSFSGNLRCMDLTFSKRTKTISHDPYTQSENVCFIRLKCAGPQVVPTNMQKTSKTTYVRSTSTRLAGTLTTWVAKRRRPVSSSGDQWRQRTFLSWPNCNILSIPRMILHVLYLDGLHSGSTKAFGCANIGCPSTFPLKQGANCWLQLTTDTKQSHRFWIQQYVCR